MNELREKVARAIYRDDEYWPDLSPGMRDDYFRSADAVLTVLKPLLEEREWRPIETVPKDVPIVFAYFGEIRELHGAARVGHSFQWDSMPKACYAAWPFTTDPTHWKPLGDPPALQTPVTDGETKASGKPA